MSSGLLLDDAPPVIRSGGLWENQFSRLFVDWRSVHTIYGVPDDVRVSHVHLSLEDFKLQQPFARRYSHRPDLRRAAEGLMLFLADLGREFQIFVRIRGRLRREPNSRNLPGTRTLPLLGGFGHRDRSLSHRADSWPN